MQFEIDEIRFNIIPSTKVKSIQISKISKETITIKVPSQTPHKELIENLKSNISYYKNQFNSQQDTCNFHHIEIFQKRYKIIYDVSYDTTYVKENYIYTSINPHSPAANSKKIKGAILNNHIITEINNWEERFNTLLYDIILRELKSNYYTISHKNKTITYSRKLIENSIDYINYIIALSIFELLKISQRESDDLLNTYVHDWKMSKKIESHERNK